jgi:hypothetical protein
MPKPCHTGKLLRANSQVVSPGYVWPEDATDARRYSPQHALMIVPMDYIRYGTFDLSVRWQFDHIGNTGIDRATTPSLIGHDQVTGALKR